MIPFAWLGGAAAVLLVVGGAYMAGQRAGRDGCQAAAARDAHVAGIAADAAATAAAAAISKIKVQHRTVQSEVQREISERVVYRECVHSPEQLQRINTALTGSQPAAGSGVLPGADTAGRPEFRSDDGEVGRGGRPVP